MLYIYSTYLLGFIIIIVFLIYSFINSFLVADHIIAECVIFYLFGNNDIKINLIYLQGGFKMKFKLIILIMILIIACIPGCAEEPNVPPDDAQNNETTPPETTPDVVTTASIVDNETDFEKAIGTSGTWIICALNDLTFDKNLALEGEYTNGKKDEDGQDIIQRKIALYTQDDDRNVTARFTLTAPKLTISSPNASIQNGTFVGDLYVTVPDFQLVDTKVDGNVYFTSSEAQDAFNIDQSSEVTGDQKLQD